jgi:hypothetical protein
MDTACDHETAVRNPTRWTIPSSLWVTEICNFDGKEDESVLIIVAKVVAGVPT